MRKEKKEQSLKLTYSKKIFNFNSPALCSFLSSNENILEYIYQLEKLMIKLDESNIEIPQQRSSIIQVTSGSWRAPPSSSFVAPTPPSIREIITFRHFSVTCDDAPPDRGLSTESVAPVRAACASRRCASHPPRRSIYGGAVSDSDIRAKA